MPMIWCQVRSFPLSFPNFYYDVNMLLPRSSLLLLEQHDSSHTFAAENSFLLMTALLSAQNSHTFIHSIMRYRVPWISLLGLQFLLWKPNLQNKGEKRKNCKPVKYIRSCWIIWASKFSSLSFGAAILRSVRGQDRTLPEVPPGAGTSDVSSRVFIRLGAASWALHTPEHLRCMRSQDVPCQVSPEGERNES